MVGNAEEKNRFFTFDRIKRSGIDIWWYSFYAKSQKTGKESNFFISYTILNGYKKSNQIIYKENEKGTKPSYIMVRVGRIENKSESFCQLFPMDQLRLNKINGKIEIGDNILFSEKQINGKIKNSPDSPAKLSNIKTSATAEWKIKIVKNLTFDMGFITSPILERLNYAVLNNLWHAEGIKSYFDGYITFKNQKYIISQATSYACCDKHWGSQFPKRWFWATSSDLKSKITGRRLNNSALVLGGGNFFTKVFNKNVKRIIASIHHENRSIEFNFFKFWDFHNLDYSLENNDGHYHLCLHGRKKNTSLIVNLYASKDKSIRINYQSPLNPNQFFTLAHACNGHGTMQIYDDKNRLLDDIEISHLHCCTTLNMSNS